MNEKTRPEDPRQSGAPRTRRREATAFGAAPAPVEHLEPRTFLSAANPTLTILPLGDSLTYGYIPAPAPMTGGYRSVLYQDLAQNGQPAHFVGSVHDDYSTFLQDANNAQHEGHGAYTVRDISQNLDGVGPSTAVSPNNGGHWLDGVADRPAIYPDLILLQAGTNDILSNHTAAQAASDMDALIQKIVTERPHAELFVAKIVPLADPALNTELVKYNDLLQSTVIPKYQRLGAPVILVDNYSPFLSGSGAVVTADLSDGIHPNATGYQLMGAAWFQAIERFENAPLGITSQPVSQSVVTGQTATFTAAASGNPVPTVQWQVSQGGAPFADIPGATSSSYAVIASAWQSGNLYRAVFTSGASAATSAAASLSVVSGAPLQVIVAPKSVTVRAGAAAIFTAAATGSPSPGVQWQVSADGGKSFNAIAGATGSRLSIPGQPYQTGLLYRAVFTNSLGSVATSAAMLTVQSAPVITFSPTSQMVANGKTVTFSAAGYGSPTPSIQWQVSSNGGKSYVNAGAGPRIDSPSLLWSCPGCTAIDTAPSLPMRLG